nr:MAG: hypothetical protein [Eriocheir sinensis tombusvirus 2]
MAPNKKANRNKRRVYVPKVRGPAPKSNQAPRGLAPAWTPRTGDSGSVKSAPIWECGSVCGSAQYTPLDNESVAPEQGKEQGQMQASDVPVGGAEDQKSETSSVRTFLSRASGGMVCSMSPLSVAVDSPMVFSRPEPAHAIEPVYENYGFFGNMVVSVKKTILKCIGAGDLVRDWEADTAFRNAVSREMTISRDYGSKGPAALLQKKGDAPVEVYPHFAAAVAVGLRMKLGVGAMVRTPDNIALVRREIPRMLRDYNVRQMDLAAHLDVIEAAFFDDQTHGRVARWRSRAARRNRFVRWLVGQQPPAYDW